MNNLPSKRLTPGQTIRAYCLQCVDGSSQDVKACDATDPKYQVCPFHPFRLGKGKPSVRVIRELCLHCMDYSTDSVRDCETTDCLCYPYRMGKNPARAGKGHFAILAREKKLNEPKMNEGFGRNFQRSPATDTSPS